MSATGTSAALAGGARPGTATAATAAHGDLRPGDRDGGPRRSPARISATSVASPVRSRLEHELLAACHHRRHQVVVHGNRQQHANAVSPVRERMAPKSWAPLQRQDHRRTSARPTRAAGRMTAFSSARRLRHSSIPSRLARAATRWDDCLELLTVTVPARSLPPRPLRPRRSAWTVGEGGHRVEGLRQRGRGGRPGSGRHEVQGVLAHPSSAIRRRLEVRCLQQPTVRPVTLARVPRYVRNRLAELPRVARRRCEYARKSRDLAGACPCARSGPGA